MYGEIKKPAVVWALFLWMGAGYGSDFSVFGGWSQTGPLNLSGQRFDLSNLALVGVRYEKDFLAVLGFENTVAYSHNSLVEEGEGSSPGLLYSGNLVLNIPADNLVPFFTVGFGVLRKFEGSFPELGSTFLTNYGFGIKLRQIVGNGGLRLDYRRYRFHDVLGEGLSANEISGGVLFSF